MRDKSQFKCWLYQIAYRTAVNHINKKRFKLISYSKDPSIIECFKYSPDYPLGDEDDRVAAILSSLNHKEHALLTLRVVEEMSYSEISQIMGVSSSVLRKRYERLVRRIKRDFCKEAEHE